MIRKSILIILLAFAAGTRMLAGEPEIHQLSLAGGSAATGGFGSLSDNPAGLSHLTVTLAGAGTENRFLIRELSSYRAALAIPWTGGVSGFLVSSGGNNRFRESALNLVHARKFGKTLSVGLRVTYTRKSFAEPYAATDWLAATLGFGYEAGQPFSFGFRITMHFPTGAASADERTMPTLGAGMAWRFPARWTVSAEAEKEFNTAPLARITLTCLLNRSIYAGTTVSTGPVPFQFTLGFAYGRVIAEVRSGYHTVLGFSPSCSVTYRFKHKPA